MATYAAQGVQQRFAFIKSAGCQAVRQAEVGQPGSLGNERPVDDSRITWTLCTVQFLSAASRPAPVIDCQAHIGRHSGNIFSQSAHERPKWRPFALSREHCRITFVNGLLEVTDLGSRNGTHVNGNRISIPTRLRHKDLIQVGDTEITVLLELEQDDRSTGTGFTLQP